MTDSMAARVLYSNLSASSAAEIGIQLLPRARSGDIRRNHGTRIRRRQKRVQTGLYSNSGLSRCQSSAHRRARQSQNDFKIANVYDLPN